MEKDDYRDGVKQRGIDPGHEVIQVFAGPSEHKIGESWEDGACSRWWMSAFQIGARSRGEESNGERFKVGQHTQASDERLG
jgi:hypothetical protein